MYNSELLGCVRRLVKQQNTATKRNATVFFWQRDQWTPVAPTAQQLPQDSENRSRILRFPVS